MVLVYTVLVGGIFVTAVVWCKIAKKVEFCDLFVIHVISIGKQADQIFHVRVAEAVSHRGVHKLVGGKVAFGGCTGSSGAEKVAVIFCSSGKRCVELQYSSTAIRFSFTSFNPRLGS